MRKYTDEQFIEAVAKNSSIRKVLIDLGLRPTGGNYKTVHIKTRALCLDTSHWTGQGHLRGKSNIWHPKKTLEEILVINSKYTNSSKLKIRIIKEGLLEHKCYRCRNREWLGKPIPLELEHKNGNKFDNRIQNLTLLCPNCHALTPTYRGKNKCRSGGMADATDLDLSAYEETCRVESLKVGETYKMVIPSQAEKSEGVET